MTVRLTATADLELKPRVGSTSAVANVRLTAVADLELVAAVQASAEGGARAAKFTVDSGAILRARFMRVAVTSLPHAKDLTSEAWTHM